MGSDSSQGQVALPAAGTHVAQILVLSDDDALIATIRALLQMSRHPRCEVTSVSASQFVPEQALTADCIFLDKVFAGRPPEWALDGIRQIVSILTAQPPRIVLLCDPHTLSGDLKHMAMLARAGVDEFLLRTQMSCQSLLESAGLINPHSLSIAPEPSYPPAPHAAPQSPPLSQAGAQLDKQPDLTSILDGTSDPFISHFNELTGNISDEDWLEHTVNVDLDNQQVVTEGVPASPLFNQDSNIALSKWLGLLTPASREELESVFERARNYQNLPTTVSCHFNQGNTITLLGHLEDIQAENNGQGRVGGIRARLILPNENNPSKNLDEDQPPIPRFIDEGSNPETEKLTDTPNVLESLPTTCLLLDEQGLVKQILHNPLSASGQLPEIKIDQDLGELLDDEQLNQLTDNIKRTLNTGQDYNAVISYASDVGLRWLDTHLCKLRGKSGIEREVLWTASDITESRRNLQEAIKNYESLEQIVQLSPVLFYEKSHSGHYRQVNAAFAKFVGLETNQILGRSDVELFDGPLLRHFTKLEKKQLENIDETTRYSETFMDESSNAMATIEWRGHAIKLKQGKGIESLIGFGILNPSVTASTSKTNTALKSAEGSLPAEGSSQHAEGSLPAEGTLSAEGSSHAEDSSHAEGSSRNAEGSSLVDLEQARTDKLESELEQKSRYEGSGILKQDFKAMLASVTNYTDMALRQKFSNRQQTLLDQLEQLDATTKRAKELLNSKMDNAAGDKPEKESPAPVSSKNSIALKPIVERVIEKETRSMPANLRFTCQLAEDAGKAFATADEIEKILQLIIAGARENAEKTPNSEIKFSHLTLSNTITTENCFACGERPDGEQLEIAIHTNEPSVSPSDLETLAANARQAMKNINNSEQNHNIIALTHAQGGHTLLEYKNSTLSLKLLFKKDLN